MKTKNNTTLPTYTKSIITQEPCLSIYHDTFADSPRDRRMYEPLGTFITNEKNYRSPDGTESIEWHAMNDTASEATSTENHAELIEKYLQDNNIKVYCVYPVCRYEHGNVIYRLSNGEKGFDISNSGFYIVTDDNIVKYGNGKMTTKEVISIVKRELQEYTDYVNGEVYSFELLDELGELQESGGNIYDLDELKSMLPDAYKNTNLYDLIK